jgi:hypothetical protein
VAIVLCVWLAQRSVPFPPPKPRMGGDGWQVVTLDAKNAARTVRELQTKYSSQPCSRTVYILKPSSRWCYWYFGENFSLPSDGIGGAAVGNGQTTDYLIRQDYWDRAGHGIMTWQRIAYTSPDQFSIGTPETGGDRKTIFLRHIGVARIVVFSRTHGSTTAYRADVTCRLIQPSKGCLTMRIAYFESARSAMDFAVQAVRDLMPISSRENGRDRTR